VQWIDSTLHYYLIYFYPFFTFLAGDFAEKFLLALTDSGLEGALRGRSPRQIAMDSGNLIKQDALF
jgi:hypothetical protein